MELAAGGMATVYLARTGETEDGHLVAIKRPHRHLATDKVFLSMLIDEARLASAIDHPNVVKVRELGFEGGEPFVVMDYVEGASLSELRKALSAMGRTLDLRCAVRIVLDALAGLHAAHETRDESGKHLGIVHRDVSPHNVLVSWDGHGSLTDFGIAKAEDRIQTTRTHEVKGKLAYLAPERVDRRRLCTVQSDVFSMAVVLWECLAGRRLFRGEQPIETLQEVMSAPIPKLRSMGANVPAAIDDVVARALSRDLETRYATAKEFAEALEGAAKGGKGHLGSAEDVARIVDVVFGERMAIRHEQLRRAVGGAEIDGLLAASKLPKRPKPKDEEAAVRESVIAALAPLAPSARYTFGQISHGAETEHRIVLRRRRLTLLTAVGAGALLGGVVVLGFVARRTPTPAAASLPGPVLAPTTGPESLGRRVVVPLPLPAVRVLLDDIVKDLDPPMDVAAFELPKGSGPHHRLVVTGVDGARAEGYVVESSGFARVDDKGFAVTPAPTASPRPAASGSARPRPVPVGTTKNGFTKLR